MVSIPMLLLELPKQSLVLLYRSPGVALDLPACQRKAALGIRS